MKTPSLSPHETQLRIDLEPDSLSQADISSSMIVPWSTRPLTEEECVEYERLTASLPSWEAKQLVAGPNFIPPAMQGAGGQEIASGEKVVVLDDSAYDREDAIGRLNPSQIRSIISSRR